MCHRLRVCSCAIVAVPALQVVQPANSAQHDVRRGSVPAVHLTCILRAACISGIKHIVHVDVLFRDARERDVHRTEGRDYRHNGRLTQREASDGKPHENGGTSKPQVEVWPVIRGHTTSAAYAEVSEHVLYILIPIQGLFWDRKRYDFWSIFGNQFGEVCVVAKSSCYNLSDLEGEGFS